MVHMDGVLLGGLCTLAVAYGAAMLAGVRIMNMKVVIDKYLEMHLVLVRKMSTLKTCRRSGQERSSPRSRHSAEQQLKRIKTKSGNNAGSSWMGGQSRRLNLCESVGSVPNSRIQKPNQTANRQKPGRFCTL